MALHRRDFLTALATGSALTLTASPLTAAPTSRRGRDAALSGVRPDSSDDQTSALQRAIDDAAERHVPLALPPGNYRTGTLRPRPARSCPVCAALRG